VAVEESNTSRFQAPPSAFIHSTKANSVRMIRNRAMDNQTYSSSVIPILLYLFTFEMFLKCSYTILAVIRKVLLYKTMDLFLFFSLGLYGPGCTTCGVGVSDIGWIRIRA
jgi:hypothetical protein